MRRTSARNDWCAVCVADRIRHHGRFDGTTGLLPAVTTVQGTRLCGPHAEEQMQEILGRAEIEARA